MLINIKASVADVVSQLEAQDILYYTDDEILDEVCLEHTHRKIQQDICNGTIKEFMDLFLNHISDFSADELEQIKKAISKHG